MKINRNDHFRIDLSNIIKRLPLLRHINASQSALISFTPAWNHWALENLPENFLTSTTLNSFNDGILSIRCATPIAASQLKHQQVSILNALHSAEHYQILRIKIQIDHQTSESIHANSPNNLMPTDNPALTTTRAALSQQAINDINNCQKGVKSEKLSNALKRLSDTLKEDN